MKKETNSKKIQALKLNRETLRDLEAGALKVVAGAATVTQCSNGTACTAVSCPC